MGLGLRVRVRVGRCTFRCRCAGSAKRAVRAASEVCTPGMMRAVRNATATSWC